MMMDCDVRWVRRVKRVKSRACVGVGDEWTLVGGGAFLKMLWGESGGVEFRGRGLGLVRPGVLIC